MLPYFVLDQITFGPIKIYTWGLFVGLGFSAGYLLFYYLAKKESLAPKKIAGLGLAIFFGAILGAKILAAATLPGGLFKNISLIFSQHSGVAFIGGLIGAILFGWGYVRIIMKGDKIPPNPPFLKGGAGGVNFWHIADLLVLPICLGIGIGRIGCILINDHQGAITNLPWGILWPDGVLRHPVGIYESLVGFGLLAVFWWVQKILANKNSDVIPAPRPSEALSEGGEAGIQNPEPGSRVKPWMTETKKDGRLFLLFLLSYSLIRFFLEFTRVASGPLADPRWGILSVSQWFALLLLTLSAVMVLLNKGRNGKFPSYGQHL